MRSILLALSFCLATPVLAQEAPPAEPPVEAPGEAPPPAADPAPAAESAPATVLEHAVRVQIDAAKRAKTDIRWVVRIDDPAACAAGLVAPEGLDGSSDGMASVFGGTLLVSPDTPAGTVFTLTSSATSDLRGSHSGGFLTAPDLPVERATFEVRAPIGSPLHVWHDPTGVPEIGSKGGRTVSVTWEGAAADRPAELVWSTWEDWMSAGNELAQAVDAKLASKTDLGREMASGYTGLHLGEAAERVQQVVEVDPNGETNWLRATSAVETLAIGRGSPVDRGVVLLSLLRLAGYDAEPGYYRPANARGSFPLTVPAPAMLGRPLIVVHLEDGDAILDPASDRVRAPATPADVIGGVTWLPGDLPTPFAASATVDGTVTINGTVAIKGDGSATWSAEITASGTAEQRLRELLAPLDTANRTEALQRLVRTGRPELARFNASTGGIEKARAKLKISISGYDAALLTPLGAGLQGEVPALIAPALAAWLPPNLNVREVLSIQVPQAVEIVSATAPDSGFTAAALIARTSEKKGSRIALVTEVERPYRTSTNALEVQAATYLAEQAVRGPHVLVHTAANKDAIALLRSSSLDETDKLVIEAVLWWRQRIGAKANKALKTAITSRGAKASAASLERYGAGERHLWSLLAQNAEKSGDAIDRLDVMAGAARSGHRTLAWELARELAQDEEVETEHRAQATLWLLELQPTKRPKTDAEDPLWVEPAHLVEQAAQWVGEGDPRVAMARAELAREDDDWAGVLTALSAVKGAPTPAARALAAEARAETAEAVREVLAELELALAAAPNDPDVLGSAAAIAGHVGEHRKAQELALVAARMDPERARRWDVVSKHAVAAGDLSMASYAARRASDLTPNGPKRAERLALVAALTHDDHNWQTARTRKPDAMSDLAGPMADVQRLMEIAPPEGLLGVLQFHDAVVVNDPGLLGIRAQMRLDAGMLDEASRDGVLLATRYGQADGVALAYAASAGRVYSSTWPQRLEQAARTSVAARSTRMEVGLILGNSDPTVDARELEGDPRSAIVARLRTDAKGLAAEVEGWPVDAASPALSVPGYRANARLGAAPGVSAVSNADTGTSILRTVTSEQLPPPLHQLYTASAQPLATLKSGAVVHRLDGGSVPLYYARTADPKDGTLVLHAVGLSVEAVGRALGTALE